MVSAILLGVLLGGSARAQPPPDQAPTRIRVQVNEVIVPITVTDDKGRFVTNMDPSDFRIFDEGREQTIRYFNREHRQPIVVGFLIDLSNNMRLHWKNYQDAATELVLALLPGEPKYTGYLISYHSEAELLVNTTHDPEPMVDKLRKVKPGGGAALYDAIYMACTRRELVKGEPYEPRRVIVIVGDGHDSASKKSVEEVLEIAQRSLVTIHAISTVAFGFASEGQSVLERLASETGGRVEYPLNRLYKNVSGYLSNPSDEGNYAYQVGTGGYAAEISSGIVRAIQGIAGEITTQYIIRYVPDADAAAKPRQFRRLRVEVKLQNVKVRARNGYYPEPVTPAP